MCFVLKRKNGCCLLPALRSADRRKAAVTKTLTAICLCYVFKERRDLVYRVLCAHEAGDGSDEDAD